MKRKPLEYEDDDGRTIADMSEVRRRNLFIPQTNPRMEESKRGDRIVESGASKNTPLNRKETRSFIFGALSAGLLIALVFIVALGLAIALMLFFWNH